MDNRDSDIINDICSSHNIELISKLSFNGLEKLKNILENNIHKVKFKGLFTILKNKINFPQTMEYTNCYGAERVVYMVNKEYNKYIYLIGERHMEYNPCGNKNISNLILNDIKYSDKFIDIFLEYKTYLRGVQYVSRGEIGKNNVLGNLSKTLTSCILPDKLKCEYYNLRSHAIDPRINLPFMYSQPLKYLASLLYNIQFLYVGNDIKSLEEHKKIYDGIRLIKNDKSGIWKSLLKDKETIQKNFKTMFNQFTKFAKNINNIDDKKLVNQIMSYILTIISKNNYDTLIYDNLIKLLDSSLDTFKQVMRWVFDFTMLWMDAYLISRLFRKYKQVKYQNSNPAKYCIIVSGDAHIRNYIKLFTEMGFERKFEILKDENGCLRNVPSFLFT